MEPTPDLNAAETIAALRDALTTLQHQHEDLLIRQDTILDGIENVERRQAAGYPVTPIATKKRDWRPVQESLWRMRKRLEDELLHMRQKLADKERRKRDREKARSERTLATTRAPSTVPDPSLEDYVDDLMVQAEYRKALAQKQQEALLAAAQASLAQPQAVLPTPTAVQEPLPDVLVAGRRNSMSSNAPSFPSPKIYGTPQSVPKVVVHSPKRSSKARTQTPPQSLRQTPPPVPDIQITVPTPENVILNSPNPGSTISYVTPSGRSSMAPGDGMQEAYAQAQAQHYFQPNPQEPYAPDPYSYGQYAQQDYGQQPQYPHGYAPVQQSTPQQGVSQLPHFPPPH